HHIAVFYGFAVAIFAFVFAKVILTVDAEETGVAPSGFAGVDVLVFMFARFPTYPQPLLMIVLGLGTMILGGIAGNPARDPDNAQRAGGEPGPRPQDGPAPVVTFEKPKTPPPATQFPGLVAYWNFDEDGGDKAREASPRQLEATLHGGKRVPGIRGKAVELNGTSDYVDLGRSPDLDFAAGAPFTVAGWVRTSRPHGA